MSINRFLNRVHDPANYNCAHFVVDVWQHLTGVNLRESFSGFLLPHYDRYVKTNLLRGFNKLIEPVSPCIVLMRNNGMQPHVGVFYKGKILHLADGGGVEFQEPRIATMLFKRISYYTT